MTETNYNLITVENGVPIKAWTKGVQVEASAEQQLRNVAQLPFIHKWVAAMPDIHWGIGATVGSVIPTKGAIIPAAVGVDIGCFTGDTLVPLLNGKSYSIRELAEAEKEIIVYACAPSGKVVAAKATARKTRTQASLVKVMLDNGQEIRCTPDHRFMLRDGSYVEAACLAPDTSLMPLYKQLDPEGYMRVKQNYSGRWQRAHWMIARSGLLGAIPRFQGQKTIIHHKNFNEADNSPEHLQFTGDADHSAYHRGLVDRNQHWQSPEFEEKRKRALSAKAQTEEGHQYFAERGTHNILRYLEEQPDHFKEAVAGNGQRGKSYLIAYNQSERGRQKSKEIAHRLYTCETCGEKLKSGFGIHNHRRSKHGYNHKVVGVIPLAERADVYCLTVPEYHNFALEAGVFVHNCGMLAAQTTLHAHQLPDNLRNIRRAIEKAVPHGRTDHGGRNDRGAWRELPRRQQGVWRQLAQGYKTITDKYPKLDQGNHVNQLGTLGTGNHFIEVCLDENEQVWFLLHSGSRGVGNRIGSFFIEMAKSDMRRHLANLPDKDLAYFEEGSQHFDDYVDAVSWAQEFARYNRKLMMEQVVDAVANSGEVPEFALTETAVNCHHNYVQREEHYGEEVFVTRKGAVRAGAGELGIIPGSMGARSYIVRGLGNPESFHSCFPAGIKLLTETGVMLIEDVYRCADEVKLITYNHETRQFEATAIVAKSVRIAPTAHYAVSQTGRRKNNVITCTDDHPFATYRNASLVYQPVSEIAASLGGVVVPTALQGLGMQTPDAEAELTLYYLIGVILSDGTIFTQEWSTPAFANGRPRVRKYKQNYLRIYQSRAAEKAPFVEYLRQQLARFASSVSIRLQPPRMAVLNERTIQGNGLTEITVSDQIFVEEVKCRIAALSMTLLRSKALALHFLAGYLDGDGAFNRDHVSISIGKQTNCSPVVYALLSLGVPYHVYNNRSNLVVEFRNNVVLEALREICQRLRIASLPERWYGEKLMLAEAVLNENVSYEVQRKARLHRLINLEALPVELRLDPALAMNRIQRIGLAGEKEVYNFTVAANHNFIVMSDFYTPLLVHNCSHGAGRLMSRNEAKRRFTTGDHEKATAGIECRKDQDVIDETPGCYKPIDDVMRAQADLVEVVHTLRQVVCVKG